MPDYDSALGMIEKAESGAAAGEPFTPLVDVNEALSNRMDFKVAEYNEALAILGEGEALRPAAGPKAMRPTIVRPKVPETPKETVEAAKEIKELVGGAGRAFEKKVAKETVKVKKGELVLPGLSLQDQISELEKISLGLDERVFSDDQLNIIIYEADGLKEKLKGENTELLDTFQKNLIAVRNQRLDEVRAKLKI